MIPTDPDGFKVSQAVPMLQERAYTVSRTRSLFIIESPVNSLIVIVNKRILDCETTVTQAALDEADTGSKININVPPNSGIRASFVFLFLY